MAASKEELLLLSCYSSNTEAVKQCLEAGADSNARDEEGFSALHAACATGNADMVQLLLRHGADVNAIDAYGDTPLMFASAGGHLECVKVLLDTTGVDIWHRSRDNLTAAQAAEANGQRKVVQYFHQRHFIGGLDFSTGVRLRGRLSLVDSGSGYKWAHDRVFVLSDKLQSLYFWEGDTDVVQTSIRRIRLPHITRVDHQPDHPKLCVLFSITVLTGRRLPLMAPTKEEAATWVQAIRHACRQYIAVYKIQGAFRMAAAVRRTRARTALMESVEDKIDDTLSTPAVTTMYRPYKRSRVGRSDRIAWAKKHYVLTPHLLTEYSTKRDAAAALDRLHELAGMGSSARKKFANDSSAKKKVEEANKKWRFSVLAGTAGAAASGGGGGRGGVKPAPLPEGEEAPTPPVKKPGGKGAAKVLGDDVLSQDPGDPGAMVGSMDRHTGLVVSRLRSTFDGSIYPRTATAQLLWVERQRRYLELRLSNGSRIVLRAKDDEEAERFQIELQARIPRLAAAATEIARIWHAYRVRGKIFPEIRRWAALQVANRKYGAGTDVVEGAVTMIQRNWRAMKDWRTSNPFARIAMAAAMTRRAERRAKEKLEGAEMSKRRAAREAAKAALGDGDVSEEEPEDAATSMGRLMKAARRAKGQERRGRRRLVKAAWQDDGWDSKGVRAWITAAISAVTFDAAPSATTGGTSQAPGPAAGGTGSTASPAASPGGGGEEAKQGGDGHAAGGDGAAGPAQPGAADAVRATKGAPTAAKGLHLTYEQMRHIMTLDLMRRIVELEAEDDFRRAKARWRRRQRRRRRQAKGQAPGGEAKAGEKEVADSEWDDRSPAELSASSYEAETTRRQKYKVKGPNGRIIDVADVDEFHFDGMTSFTRTSERRLARRLMGLCLGPGKGDQDLDTFDKDMQPIDQIMLQPVPKDLPKRLESVQPEDLLGRWADAVITMRGGRVEEVTMDDLGVTGGGKPRWRYVQVEGGDEEDDGGYSAEQGGDTLSKLRALGRKTGDLHKKFQSRLSIFARSGGDLGPPGSMDTAAARRKSALGQGLMGRRTSISAAAEVGLLAAAGQMAFASGGGDKRSLSKGSSGSRGRASIMGAAGGLGKAAGRHDSFAPTSNGQGGGGDRRTRRSQKRTLSALTGARSGGVGRGGGRGGRGGGRGGKRLSIMDKWKGRGSGGGAGLALGGRGTGARAAQLAAAEQGSDSSGSSSSSSGSSSGEEQAEGRDGVRRPSYTGHFHSSSSSGTESSDTEDSSSGESSGPEEGAGGRRPTLPVLDESVPYEGESSSGDSSSGEEEGTDAVGREPWSRAAPGPSGSTGGAGPGDLSPPDASSSSDSSDSEDEAETGTPAAPAKRGSPVYQSMPLKGIAEGHEPGSASDSSSSDEEEAGPPGAGGGARQPPSETQQHSSMQDASWAQDSDSSGESSDEEESAAMVAAVSESVPHEAAATQASQSVPAPYVGEESGDSSGDSSSDEEGDAGGASQPAWKAAAVGSVQPPAAGTALVLDESSDSSSSDEEAAAAPPRPMNPAFQKRAPVPAGPAVGALGPDSSSGEDSSDEE